MCVINQYIENQKSHKNSVLDFCWNVVTTRWSQVESSPLTEVYPLQFGNPHVSDHLLEPQPRVSCHLPIRSCCCFPHSGIFLGFYISTKSGKRKTDREGCMNFLTTNLLHSFMLLTWPLGHRFSDPQYRVSVSVRVWSRKQDHCEWRGSGDLLCSWGSWERSLHKSGSGPKTHCCSLEGQELGRKAAHEAGKGKKTKNPGTSMPLFASNLNEARELRKKLMSFTCAWPRTQASWRKRSSRSSVLIPIRWANIEISDNIHEG